MPESPEYVNVQVRSSKSEPLEPPSPSACSKVNRIGSISNNDHLCKSLTDLQNDLEGREEDFQDDDGFARNNPGTTQVFLRTRITDYTTMSECLLNRWILSVLQSLQGDTADLSKIKQAIADHKIFIIIGRCGCVRRPLINRGWVEKPGNEVSLKTINLKVLGSAKKKGGKPLKILYDLAANVYKLLKLRSPDMIWNYSNQWLTWSQIGPDQLVSQVPGAPSALASKIGISECIQQSHWFSMSEMGSLNFPRCYRMLEPEEKAVFMSDYCLTACFGLLKWLIANFGKGGLSSVIGGKPGVPWDQVNFAIAQTNHYVQIRKHEDLEQSKIFPAVSRWETFLQHYNHIISKKLKLASSIAEKAAQDIVASARAALAQVPQFWPQFKSEGMNNVWICKPGFRCGGKGIVIINKLTQIDLVENSLLDKRIDLNWVVQKYIERPFLIHNTKFDIRQWFLISCWNPLTVWIYGDCYLRFCSKPYDIEDFHERIHLCNTSVQSKYHLAANISGIPRDKIWNRSTFLEFLDTLGQGEVWGTKLYPGMKQGIVATVLSSFHAMLELAPSPNTIRRNSFEFYGADFLIDEDFVPWLLEVNSTPLLQVNSQTFVRMRESCMEDVFKVILDQRENSNASTGKFELIYRQKKPVKDFLPVTTGTFDIDGVSLNRLKNKQIEQHFRRIRAESEESEKEAAEAQEADLHNAIEENADKAAKSNILSHNFRKTFWEIVHKVQFPQNVSKGPDLDPEEASKSSRDGTSSKSGSKRGTSSSSSSSRTTRSDPSINLTSAEVQRLLSELSTALTSADGSRTSLRNHCSTSSSLQSRSPSVSPAKDSKLKKNYKQGCLTQSGSDSSTFVCVKQRT